MTETVPAQTTETADAVDFDGVEDYLSRSSDLVGNSDVKAFTDSFWLYHTPKSGTIIRNGTQQQMLVFDDGHITFQYKNAAGTNILSIDISANNTIPFNTWTHVMYSVDLTNSSKRHLYINDQSVSDSAFKIYVNDLIKFTQSNHSIGARIG